MVELNGFQRNAAMARAMSGAKTMPVGMGNLTAQWGADAPEVQLRAPPPSELARGVASRAAPGYVFPDRQPWNAPTMSQVYDGLSQSPELDMSVRQPRVTPIPRNVPRSVAPNARGIMDMFPIEELDRPAPGALHKAIGDSLNQAYRNAPDRLTQAADSLREQFRWNSGRAAAARAAPAESVAERIARRAGGAAKTGAAVSMPFWKDILDGARSLMTSDALGAAGATDAVGPVARTAAPLARGALGAASRFAGPAYLAAAGYGLGKDAMDPNSALRQASQPAKADMRRDWAEGNYLSAIGDAVRATAATAPEVLQQLAFPKPIWGGENQRGLLQGLFGAERPEARNARLAQEASPEGRYQAYLAAGGPADIDEFRQQTGSKATPAQAAQAAPAARQRPVPLSVLKDYAPVYAALHPKPKTYRDIAGENLLAIAAARAKQLPSLPEAQRQREQELIADLYGRVLNPQNAYGGNWLGNTEE